MVPIRLILMFRRVGDKRMHWRLANRIQIDGNGGLLVYRNQPISVERLKLGCLRDLMIRGTDQPTTAFLA